VFKNCQPERVFVPKKQERSSKKLYYTYNQTLIYCANKKLNWKQVFRPTFLASKGYFLVNETNSKKTRTAT
jgi:hypothetical protein